MSGLYATDYTKHRSSVLDVLAINRLVSSNSYQLTAAEQGAAPDRLQLRSSFLLATLPTAGELVRSAAARGVSGASKSFDDESKSNKLNFIMKARPASSRHLSAFAIDVDDLLGQTGLFSRITIKKTGLSKCALNIICLLADGTITQTEVTAILDQVWNALAYYRGENSYKITTATGEVQMQFATSTEEVSVTGRIEVVGFK